MEVDTPVLSSATVPDPNVDSLQTEVRGQDSLRYLHTSPEFPMKRLLAAGCGDIYQICKVFRQGEIGRNHNPEFTLLEWYRVGYDHHRLMDDMSSLLKHALPEINAEPPLRITYREAFKALAGIDSEAGPDQLANTAIHFPAVAPEGLTEKDQWLDWLMSTQVAPRFPKDRFTFVYDYPASQAALSRIREGDSPVAERFEVYWGDLELANGFHELTDADEQRARFNAERAQRRQQGAQVPPLDERLLAALEKGLPDCAGVALGLDRLLMVCLGKTVINDVLAFGFENA